MREKTMNTVKILQEWSIPLIAGVILAVLLANDDAEAYHHLVHWTPFGEGSHVTFHFLVNDIFMVFFFGIAAKEIVESVLPGGALNPPKKAINPLLGTLGGIVGPVAVYLLYVQVTGAEGISNGWGIPTATDIALAWLVARAAFGKGHPAISFLLLLAIADDGVGLAIIAIFYPDPAHPVRPELLVMVAGAMAFAWALRRAGVKSFWAYLAGPGVLSWTGLFMAHLHPALALVFVVPFMPTADHDEGLFEEDHGPGHHHADTLNRFEHAFKLPVDLGLFTFGLANAGVVFSASGHATWAVLFALLIGKTVGIFTFSAVGHRLGFKLPDGMNLASLLVAGIVAAIGLTVALFVAGVAFTEPGLQGAAKMGALASVIAVPLALLAARALRVKRPEVEEEEAPADRQVVVTLPPATPAAAPISRQFAPVTGSHHRP